MKNNQKNEKAVKNFEQFIGMPLTIMRSIGIDLFKDIPWRFHGIWMRFYLMFVLVCNFYCTGCLMVQIIKNIATLNVPSLPLVLQIISRTSYTFFGVLKMIIFIKSQDKLTSLLVRFRDLSMAFSTPDDQCCYSWPKWVPIIYTSYALACSSIAILPMLNSVWDLCHQLVHAKDIKDIQFLYLHLYEVDYYFNYRSPLGYLMLYIIEIVCVHGNIIMNFCPDIWLQCLIIQLCKHYDNLLQYIKDYRPTSTHTAAPGTLCAEDYQFFQHIVVKHQLLLR